LVVRRRYLGFTNSKAITLSIHLIVSPMKKIFVSVLLLCCLCCKSQLITDSLLIENHFRSFSYYQPARSKTNGSLMFVMHGSGGSSNDMLPQTHQLEANAGKENLLVVYPNGYLHFWNECRKYSNAVANKEDVNEQAFFTAMISYFRQKFGISPNKVFAAGFSGGGQMAYKLGATMPDKIKAIIAVVANLPDSASCDCKLSGRPLPVMIINGTLDPVNPYNGGEMFVNKASFGVVLSSENNFHYWAKLAGYTGEPKRKVLPDSDTSDHKTIERFSYFAKGKPPVVLLKVVGGKHDYPGDIDVYAYAWEFFKRLR